MNDSTGTWTLIGWAFVSIAAASVVIAASLPIADTNGDRIISAPEGDIDTCNAKCFPATPSDQCAVSDNSCLYLLPTSYDRFAVAREVNDGYIAPRFAPSQRAWVLSGTIAKVSPVLPASEGRDSDDR